MNLLERVPDALVSIGLDAPTLLAFKNHTGLPTDVSWTESDSLFQAYLLSAEKQVDDLTGMPYRVRSYNWTVEKLDQYCPGRKHGHMYGAAKSFWCLRPPMRPIAISPAPAISWIDDFGNSGTYVSGTDFSTIGPTSIDPMCVFPYNFVAPSVSTVPYPFVLSFTAGGGLDATTAQICIFEYAAAYYRNPESAGKELSFVSQVFDANLTALLGSFL